MTGRPIDRSDRRDPVTSRRADVRDSHTYDAFALAMVIAIVAVVVILVA